MSYISLLRNRIKVIHTIRKTTSAMRLATRAIQARLRNKNAIFNSYVQAIEMVHKQYIALQPQSTQLDKNTLQENVNLPTREIIILIGSHKGLCGAFNERLFAYFRRSIQLNARQFITVGTQATQFSLSQGYHITHNFNVFTSTTLLTIAQELMQLIARQTPATITIVSNKARTFFVQQPHTQVVVAISPAQSDHIAGLLNRLKLQNTIIQILYDSLLAEQSARFLSMDNATRNAEEILAQAKVDYNKLRQALVTRELLELTNSFIQN